MITKRQRNKIAALMVLSYVAGIPVGILWGSVAGSTWNLPELVALLATLLLISGAALWSVWGWTG